MSEKNTSWIVNSPFYAIRSEYTLIDALAYSAFENGNSIYAGSISGFVKDEKFIEKLGERIKKDFNFLQEYNDVTDVTHKNIIEYDADEEREQRILWLTEEAVIHVSRTNEEYWGHIIARSSEVRSKLLDIIGERLEKRKEDSIYYLEQTMGGYHLSPVETNHQFQPLIYENYDDEVSSEFEWLAESLKAKDPPGNLLLLEGPPGTGKTYFIRSLIHNIMNECSVVVVPAHLAGSLSDPILFSAFHRRVEKDKPLVVVVEDADSCLAPRSSDNVSSISSMLNYTDGILGSTLNVRVVASTNAQMREIEPALLRKGRLLNHLQFDALSSQQALKIYDRLIGRKAKEEDMPEGVDFLQGSYTLAEIYGWTTGAHEPLKKEKRKMGF